MKILFVGKWNRFRDHSAEAIFNHLNKDFRHEARSGGFFPGVAISSDIIEAGKRIGVKIGRNQQGLSHGLLMWSDVIIIVDDGIGKSIFREIKENDGKKIVKWNDTKGKTDNNLRLIKKDPVLMVYLMGMIEKLNYISFQIHGINS